MPQRRQAGNFAGWMQSLIRELPVPIGFVPPSLRARLRMPSFAARKQYELDTYVVMPNQVHVLLWPWMAMERVASGIKGCFRTRCKRGVGTHGAAFLG